MVKIKGEKRIWQFPKKGPDKEKFELVIKREANEDGMAALTCW